MYTLRVTTRIAAPPGRCFDLARDVDAHARSAVHTGERVVAGRTSGLLELGDSITFEGRHLGVRQRLTAVVTAFDPPRHFRDTMTAGAFRSMVHDHHFEGTPDGGTVMTDVLRFVAPVGPLGWVAERLLVGPHLRRFLVARGRALQTMAEPVGLPASPLSDGPEGRTMGADDRSQPGPPSRR